MKVAVIGRGFGANVMAPAYAALGCEVTVIPSRDAAAIARVCAGPVDLVSVHSPPFQHRDHVMEALAAGRAVLCDKPFGRNGTEARAMRDAAKAAGVAHFLNFEFRCQPAWARAKQLIDAGAIGTLTHVSWTSFGNGMRSRPHGWVFDADRAGGWIGAYGAHVIDGLRFFFGREIADCGGLVRTEVPLRPDGSGAMVRATAEDAFSCWLALEGGGTAQVDSGYSASVNLPAAVHLLGSDGAISLSAETVLTLARPGTAPEVEDFTPGPGEPVFAAVPLWLEQVLAALRDGRRIAPDFDDGVAAADVIDWLKAAGERAGAEPMQIAKTPGSYRS